MIKIPDRCLIRTDNPHAAVQSPFKGLPPGFETRHKLTNPAMLKAIAASSYQTAADAFADAPKHRRIYLGDELHMCVEVDRHGNPGTIVRSEYAIRRPGTIQALLPGSAYPRHQAASPSHLCGEEINDLVLAAIDQGVPFSWSIVRPKFEQAGDILIFWPSQVPVYGSAALDKLGECPSFDVFTPEKPFDPIVIHVGLLFLSEMEFGGNYTILCGSGRKRLVVVNCGWYDGGVKKPINFQHNDRTLPGRSVFITTHWAMTKFLNGKVGAIGTTTAAGKSEGSSCEDWLDTPGVLRWTSQKPAAELSVRAMLADLARPQRLTETKRWIGSDDITAVTVRADGKPCGAEAEPEHFVRIDLCSGPGTLPIADDCASGRVKGRIHWTGVPLDPRTQEFRPWEHVMIGGQGKNTNPRLSYRVVNNPDVIPTNIGKLMDIDYLILSVPVPEIPEGWFMPTIIRVGVEDFLINNCHGARANKGNPALGAVGNGHWAFEGFGGKRGFTLDTEAMMFTRDWMKFWQALRSDTPCFIVMNGHSMGMKQEFKFSGTFLLRALLESHHDELLAAPLIKLPGAFTGGVPDLRTFLKKGELDERLWNPETLCRHSLERDARLFDSFGYDAMNRILGQIGLSTESSMWLSDQMRRFAATHSRR